MTEQTTDPYDRERRLNEIDDPVPWLEAIYELEAGALNIETTVLDRGDQAPGFEHLRVELGVQFQGEYVQLLDEACAGLRQAIDCLRRVNELFDVAKLEPTGR
jgi:hypothetical protein